MDWIEKREASVRPALIAWPLAKNTLVFQLVKWARQRENTYCEGAALRTALPKPGPKQHGPAVIQRESPVTASAASDIGLGYG
jgi:hypothetical protein